MSRQAKQRTSRGTAFYDLYRNVAHPSVTAFYAAATSPDDIWALGEQVVNPANGYSVARWNGAKWTAVPFPSLPPSLISADGHGGVWLDAVAKGGTEYLFHGTGASHWQRFALPTPKGAGPVSLNGLTLVPGTTTVYAYGATKATKIKLARRCDPRVHSLTRSAYRERCAYREAKIVSRTSRMLAAAIAATAIASVSAVSVTAANAAQAPGAARTAVPAPHWRIVAAFPERSSIDELAVSGPDSAWAAEDCTKPCASGSGVILRHWNGKTWQAEPQPANAKHTGDAEPMLATAPGSPDVWAVYNEYDHTTRASVAEWTGKSWAHPTVFPAGTNFQGVAATGSGLWAFGARQEFGNTPYVVRFTGRSWAQAPSPGPAFGPWTAVARSASDIWAQALSSKGIGLQFSHWNGTRWAGQAVPPAPKGAVGAYGGLRGDLAVSGQDNVWGFGYFEFKSGSTDYWLVHWNGKAWSNVKVPFALSPTYIAGPLGPDGHGGAWLAAIPPKTTREYLYHVTAAGHWTRLPIPTLKGATGTVLSGFAAIPGTSSVYAYGSADSASGQRGVVLKYGA